MKDIFYKDELFDEKIYFIKMLSYLNDDTYYL